MYKKLIDKLKKEQKLTKDEYKTIIDNHITAAPYLYECASDARKEIYGSDIYIRGLIELSNYCKNDCHYCGIRASNKNVSRYRLNKEEILECCKTGWNLGFHTFVLQGGEDPYYTDEILCDIISSIKQNYPSCAITLSMGERSFQSYKVLKSAGADRYLLRHETANKNHYEKLHPKNMLFETRQKCLNDLKSLGYQFGAGFMVGSPYQTTDDLAGELIYLKKLNPHMVGIGPFVPHHDTPFSDKKQGTADLTLCMLALTRLTLPRVLLPATTALGTIDPLGREKGILAGANVVMPNLSPKNVREKYQLYDNKLCTGDETAQHVQDLKKRIESVGCNIVMARGDYKNA